MANEYFVPFEDYVNEVYPDVNNIVTQGASSAIFNSAITEGGTTKDAFFREDLKDVVTSATSIFSASTAVTPDAVGSYKVTVPVHQMGFGITESNYVARRQGTDPETTLNGYMTFAANRALTFTQDYQKLVLDGVFNTSGTLNATHYSQAGLSVGTGTFSLDQFQTFMDGLYGESYFDGTCVDTLYVNTATFRQLKNYGLIGYVDDPSAFTGAATQNATNIATTGQIPLMDGKRIVINNSVCASETIGGDTAYPIYATGGSPIAVEYQTDILVLEDLVASTGGGVYHKYFYQNFAPYVKGVSYTGSTITADSDLSTVGNWSKKWNDKNIKISKFMVR
jgi:hypothetical protein